MATMIHIISNNLKRRMTKKRRYFDVSFIINLS